MLQGRVSLCGMRNIICNSRSVEENPGVYFIWTVFPWRRCRTELFICAGLCGGSLRTPFLKDAVVVSGGSWRGDCPVCTNTIGGLCLWIYKRVIKFRIKGECLPGTGWVNIQKLSARLPGIRPFFLAPLLQPLLLLPQSLPAAPS